MNLDKSRTQKNNNNSVVNMENYEVYWSFSLNKYKPRINLWGTLTYASLCPNFHIIEISFSLICEKNILGQTVAYISNYQ